VRLTLCLRRSRVWKHEPVHWTGNICGHVPQFRTRPRSEWQSVARVGLKVFSVKKLSQKCVIYFFFSVTLLLECGEDKVRNSGTVCNSMNASFISHALRCNRDNRWRCCVFTPPPPLPSQRMFPYVSVMLGNGSLSYDQDYDGRHTDLGGCTAAIRNSIYDTFLLVRYSRNRLTVWNPYGGDWYTLCNWCLFIYIFF